jgi:mRNA capping enzyme, beta chain
MSLNQHKQYNVMLNELVQKSPGVRNGMPFYEPEEKPNIAQFRVQGERVKYKHTRERDRFYKLSNGRKIRVTTDQQTGEVKSVLLSVVIRLNQ